MKCSKLLKLAIPLALTPQLQAATFIARGRYPFALDHFFPTAQLQAVVGGGLHIPSKASKASWRACLPVFGLRWMEQCEGGVLWDGLHKSYGARSRVLVQDLKGYLAGSVWNQRVHGVLLGQDCLRSWGVQAHAEIFRSQLFSSLQGRVGIQANLMLTEWPKVQEVRAILQKAIRIEVALGIFKLSFGLEQEWQIGASWQRGDRGLQACPMEAAQRLVVTALERLKRDSDEEISKENKAPVAPEINLPPENQKVAKQQEKEAEKAAQAIGSYSGVSTSESLAKVEDAFMVPNKLYMLEPPENEFEKKFRAMKFMEKIYALDDFCLSKLLPDEKLAEAIDFKDSCSYSISKLSPSIQESLKEKGFSENQLKKARKNQVSYRITGQEKRAGTLQMICIPDESTAVSSNLLFIENFSKTEKAEELDKKVKNYSLNFKEGNLSSQEEKICWEFFEGKFSKRPPFEAFNSTAEIVVFLRTVLSFKYSLCCKGLLDSIQSNAGFASQNLRI